MIRRALPSDVEAIARVHVRAWQVGYRGHIADDFLNALEPSKRAAWWTLVVVDSNVTVLVCVQSGVVVGFCTLLASRDADAAPGTGEITTLYVDPERWRSGFGAALMKGALSSARERAFSKVSLWVLASNAPARAFYEAQGFLPDGHEKTDARLGVVLHEVRYRRDLPAGLP